jgi:hypothetical protein
MRPFIKCAPSSCSNSVTLVLLLVSRFDYLFIFWVNQICQIIACGVKAWNISLFPEPLKCVNIAYVKRGLFVYFPFVFCATQVLKLLFVESKVDYLFFSAFQVRKLATPTQFPGNNNKITSEVN